MIRMNQTWFNAGVPEYEAGKEYREEEIPSGRLAVFLRRGIANRVSVPVEKQVKVTTRKKRKKR